MRTVCDIRYITLRSGFQQQVRDIIVFDHTYPNFKFSLWDPELIARYRHLLFTSYEILIDALFTLCRASFWNSRSTILFMVDIKVVWNNFFKCTTGALTSKSIITEDPIGNEADMLRKYALIAPLQASSILEKMTSIIPDRN